jgi:hypothetical protein
MHRRLGGAASTRVLKWHRNPDRPALGGDETRIVAGADGHDCAGHRGLSDGADRAHDYIDQHHDIEHDDNRYDNHGGRGLSPRTFHLPASTPVVSNFVSEVTSRERSRQAFVATYREYDAVAPRDRFSTPSSRSVTVPSCLRCPVIENRGSHHRVRRHLASTGRATPRPR